MWIFLPDGFFSVVQDRDHPEHRLQVRARAREDLERHFPNEPIVETPEADYHYRVIVSRNEFSAWMESVVFSLDYSNVKGAIPEGDVERKAAMTDVWSVMHAFQTVLEQSPARKRKRALNEEYTCVGCGCTDSQACAGGCYWLSKDAKTHTGVCSECPDKLKAFEHEAGARVKRPPIRKR
jgi:hypothetical protein